MKKLLMIVMALAAGMTAWGDEGAFAHATGAPMRVDSRTGTRIAAKGASETIAYSPKWVGAASCTVTADGTTLKTASDEGEVAWTPTTTGAHVLTHTAGDVTYTVQFAVLGDDVIQRAGTLTGNETWSSNKIHLVTGAVTVPSGKTLTIEPGTVVKFMSGTSLTANGTCTAKGVIFTHVNDDTVGGDTLMDGDEAKPVVGAYRIDGDISDDGATEYRYPEPQTLTETISSNTRLRGHMVYLAHSSITVDSGVTLTLAPGTILKFASGCSMTVNGTLEAQGTRAEPIVFTSLKDDDWGGDTNGDGENTRPGYGDWNQIRVSGTAKFNYANVFYNSATENYGGIEAYGGTVTFDNSVIAHTKYECVNAHSSGRFSACNSVFWDASLGFGYYGGSRVRAVNCVFAEMTTAIRQSDKQLTNCIFYRCQAFTDQSGDSSSFSHCLFWNPVGEGAQRYAKTGKNGNIWADPGFIDPDNGDFRLTAKSPCIDAGAGMEAPEYDFYGVRRVTVRTDGAPGTVCSNGAYPDIGIAEYVPSDADSDYDLMPTALSASVSEIHPGENLKLSWTILNNGMAEITGGWHDAFYLVSATGREILLGENTTAQPLVSGMTCSCAAEFAVPAMTEGDWYPKLVVNSRRSDVPEGTNSANNVFVASAPVAVVIPAYEYSDGTRGTLSSTGVTVLRFTFEEGTTGQIARVKVPVGTKVTYGLGFVPQGESASGALTASERGDVLFHVPAGTREVYVTLSEDVAGGEYDISFEEGDIAVSYITPESVPCVGEIPVRIVGAGFSREVSVRLDVKGGQAVIKAVVVVSQEEMLLTVDSSEMAVGAFAQLVLNGRKMTGLGITAVLQDGGPDVWARLIVPEVVREGRSFTCRVEYGNRGTSAAVAPLIEILADEESHLRYQNDSVDRSLLHYIGVGQAPVSDMLMPGFSSSVSFVFRPGKRNGVKLRIGSLSDVDFAPLTNSVVQQAVRRLGCCGCDASDYRQVMSIAEALTNNTNQYLFTGRVADEVGVPCAGKVVSCKNVLGDGDVRSAISDLSGRYCLFGLTNGQYAVEVDGARLISPTGVVSVANQDVLNVDLIVDNELSFSIAVTNLLENETFTATATDVETGKTFIASDDGNILTFNGLPDGFYSVRISSSFGRVSRHQVAMPAAYGERICCSLEFPSTIKGTYAQLSPDELVGVVLFAPEGKMSIATINSNGGFVFSDLVSGDYSLSVLSTDDSRCFVTNLTICSGETNTVVVARQEEELPSMKSAKLMDTSWLSAFWAFWQELGDNIKAIEDGNKLLNEMDFFYPGLKEKYKGTVDYMNEGSRCCGDKGRSVLEKLPAEMARLDLEIEKLRQAIAAAEVGNNYKLFKNLVLAGKDFGSYLLSLKELESGTSTSRGILLEVMNDAQDMYTRVKINGQSAGKAMLDTVFGVDMLVEDMAAFNNNLAALKDIELGSAESMRTALKSIASGASAYGRALRLAKMVVSSGNVDPATRMTAQSLIDKSAAISAIVSAAGSAASFILKMEEIGTDDTAKVWGLLRDDVRAKMGVVRWMYDDIKKQYNEGVRRNMCDCGGRGSGGCASDCKCNKPKEPMEEKDEKKPDNSQSCDPNEISGPLGVGDARYVKPGDWMTYTVYFENLSNATASAAEVYVKNPLSKWLDWSTFEMGEVAFNNQSDLGLVGLQSGISEVVMSGESYFVRSQVDLDETTGEVNWYLRSYDKTTPDTWPEDITAGLLPPNDETHRGEGHLTYRIKVREDAPRNAIIENSAEIVFDYNPVIPTNPNWWNTVGSSNAEADFTISEIAVDEGAAIELTVSGGNAEKASNVGVYLTYLTAAAADIDLKTATVDGVTPKGGIKFPLTLSWAAGEVTNRVIRIPVKTDKTVEDDETLVFKLAAAQGQTLGETTECKVTIHDTNVAADYAEKQAKTTTKTKKGVDDNYGLNIACVAGDGSGEVCGYTSGQGTYYKGCKASLKATARPGWEFKGWGEIVGGVTNVVSEKASWNVTLTNEAEIVALFGRIPYVAGLADPADGGKVTGSGYCATGKKVTLKATANKNFTFVGWYDDEGVVATQQTLVIDRSAKPAKPSKTQDVITNVIENVTYYARFKSDPEVFVTVTATDGKGDALTGKGAGKYVAGTITGMGKYAAGKKVTLKATANKGYVFAGWYEGGVDGGHAGRVTLPAGEPLSRLASYVLTMPTNDVQMVAAFVTAEEDKASIAASVNGMDLSGTSGGTPLPRCETNVMAGVYLEWPVAASALSETTVKVAGLPSGLKFSAKPVTSKVGSGKTAVMVTNVPPNTIYGAPTAASKIDKYGKVTPSEVKVTVTTAGKSSQTYQIDTTVDPLPAWAVGTFAGPSYAGGRGATALPGDAVDTNGVVTVTVATSGKISAKQPVDGKAVSFAANYFDAYDGETFRATLTAKVGKEIVMNEMAVSGHAGRVTLPDGSDAIVTNGMIVADLFDAWQYNWKAEPWKSLGKSFDKREVSYEEGGVRVTLTLSANGTAKVAGEFTDVSGKVVKASGSATLLPTVGEDGETRCLVFVYLAPKGLSPHVRCLEVPYML